MAPHATDRSFGNAAAYPSPLTGTIRDSQGRPMSPTHSKKGNLRYRYYASIDAGDSDDPAVRVSAAKLEQAALAAVAAALR